MRVSTKDGLTLLQSPGTLAKNDICYYEIFAGQSDEQRLGKQPENDEILLLRANQLQNANAYLFISNSQTDRSYDSCTIFQDDLIYLRHPSKYFLTFEGNNDNSRFAIQLEFVKAFDLSKTKNAVRCKRVGSQTTGATIDGQFGYGQATDTSKSTCGLCANANTDNSNNGGSSGGSSGDSGGSTEVRPL